MTVITTPRLRLRKPVAADAADLHAVFTQDAAMRYWSTPAHDTLAQTVEWLAGMLDQPSGQADDYVIEYEGRVIGKAGAWRLPEVGFILHPDHWRKGLMREALTAVIAHLFAAHPVAALTAEADPRNTASLALLAALGFHETGRAERTMQWGDEWCDSVYLALPRPAPDSGGDAASATG